MGRTDNGGTPADYVLEVGSAPGLANLATAMTPTLGMNVVGVPQGTYYVRVRARNSGGVSIATPDTVVVVH